MAGQLPNRIQRMRTKGWRKPDGAIDVTRSTKWGNIFVPGKPSPMPPYNVVADKRHAFHLYAAFAPLNKTLVEMAKAELKGKDLMCWCPHRDKNGLPVLCHAGILIEIANQ